MATDDPPKNNVIPFRPRVKPAVKSSVKPSPVATKPGERQNVGTLVAREDVVYYPITLEEILEALRELLLKITDGGVGLGLPQDVGGLEHVFMGMLLGWTHGFHCTDPVTGIVTIIISPEIVTQIENAFRTAGYKINQQVITDGLRVKPSYLNVIPLEPEGPVEPDDDPEPPPLMTA